MFPQEKPPPAVPEGALILYAVLPLLGDGADAGLVEAGAKLAVNGDAADGVGALHTCLDIRIRPAGTTGRRGAPSCHCRVPAGRESI